MRSARRHDVALAQLAVVPCQELGRRRELGEVGAEARELATLPDLVGVLDRVEVRRVDLVGELLELAAVGWSRPCSRMS